MTLNTIATSADRAWLVRCSINCAHASSWASRAHVGGPFDLEQAADARGYFVGDYEGMTANGTVFQPFFGMAVNRATDPSNAFFATVPQRHARVTLTRPVPSVRLRLVRLVHGGGAPCGYSAVSVVVTVSS